MVCRFVEEFPGTWPTFFTDIAQCNDSASGADLYLRCLQAIDEQVSSGTEAGCMETPHEELHRLTRREKGQEDQRIRGEAGQKGRESGG